MYKNSISHSQYSDIFKKYGREAFSYTPKWLALDLEATVTRYI